MAQFFTSTRYKKMFWIVFCLYIAFALLMIFRSSSVGIDGRRYFSLFDDGMISMRYAQNVIDGKGLVWNFGERVEGFTSPLLVSFMALAIKLFGKIYGVLAIQLLGALLLTANIFFVLQIMDNLIEAKPLKDFLKFMAVLFLVTFYPLLYWSIMGMDTGLLTTLVLLASFILVKEKSAQKINIWLPIVLSLCYLTRPESILFITAVYLFRLCKNLKRFPFLLSEILILLIPLTLYHIFRWHYYQQFYPNTYFLKATGLSLSQRIHDGFAFFYPFLTYIQLIVFWILAFFFFVLVRYRNTGKTSLRRILEGNKYHIFMFLAFFIVFSVYQIVIGGDAWPRYWRYTVPYTVLLFLAFLLAISEFKKMSPKEYFFQGVAILVFSFGLFFTCITYAADLLSLKPNQSEYNESHINAALVILELTTSKATITSSFAGVTPYYTGRKAYDPLGKVDAYIAHLAPDTTGDLSWGGMTSVPGHNKYDLNYTFKTLRPDVIVPFGYLCHFGRQNLEDWCKNNYTAITYKGVELLLKKSSPHILWGKINL